MEFTENESQYVICDEIVVPYTTCADEPRISFPKKRKSKASTQVRCEVCQVTCNSSTVYEIHIKGQKHKKKLAAANSALQSETGQPLQTGGLDLSNFNSTMNYLNNLAELNSLDLSFANIDCQSENDTTKQIEVELTIGTTTYRAQGGCLEEAQHLAAILAIEHFGTSTKDCTKPNLSDSIDESAFLPIQAKVPKKSRKSNNRKHIFPATGYSSSVVARNHLIESIHIDPSNDVEQFIQKHLIAPINSRTTLKTLIDYTFQALAKTANSMASHYAALQKPRVIDEDLMETPPQLFNPVRMTSISLSQFARLLWAIHSEPSTLDLISADTNVVRMVVFCSRQPIEYKPQNNTTLPDGYVDLNFQLF